MSSYEVIEGIKMVSIPSGSFMMGHEYRYDPDIPKNINVYFPDEQPIQSKTLKTFLLGKTTVTQGQYRKIMGDNPS